VSITLKEYTLTDYGTYLSLDPSLTSQTVIYKAAADNEDDPLLNPAHLLIGMNPQDETVALNFAAWATSPAGQSVITSFTKNGKQLHKGAP
jgi:ABC-type tungstate transport system permease subunit